MPAENREFTLTFFRQDQLAFFVTHAGNDSPPEGTIDQLIKRSVDALKDEGYTATLTPGEWISFPAVPKECYPSKLDEHRNPTITDRGESSLLFCDAMGVGGDPVQFFDLIKKLEAKLLRDPSFGEVTLQAVSLNWLVSGSPDGSGTGGPGSWPVPYRGAPDRAPFQFNNLPDIVKTSRQGKGVDVLILDTVRDKPFLDDVYRKWQGKHPLIHSLLKDVDDGGALTILRAPDAERERIKELRALGHDYEMADHGLFVAGIVHTIAPCARIYLVEVLNPYGVGDHKSISLGLKKAVAHIQQNRKSAEKEGTEQGLVVVNCSLLYDLPIEDGHCCTTPEHGGRCFVDLYPDQYRQLEEAICRRIDEDPKWLERETLALEHSCDLIYTEKSRVIAAAGNDWKPERSEIRPQARYPAALGSVQGVGALPKDPESTPDGKRKTASYSNRADRPEYIGVTTLGGEPGEGNGVLGLYLGDFPCGDKNCTNWAWWAGTSFATPIMTGIVAAVLSGQSQPTADRRLFRPPVVQTAIDILNSRNIIQQSKTDTGEDVLDVTQGYSTQPLRTRAPTPTPA